MNCSPLLVRNNYAETSLFVFNLIFQPQFTFTTVSRRSQIYGGLTGGHALWSPRCPRTHPAPFCYRDLTHCALHAATRVSGAVLQTPICTAYSLHIFHPAPWLLSPLMAVCLFSADTI